MKAALEAREKTAEWHAIFLVPVRLFSNWSSNQFFIGVCNS
jgi:hypothetical protein